MIHAPLLQRLSIGVHGKLNLNLTKMLTHLRLARLEVACEELELKDDPQDLVRHCLAKNRNCRVQLDSVADFLPQDTALLDNLGFVVSSHPGFQSFAVAEWFTQSKFHSLSVSQSSTKVPHKLALLKQMLDVSNSPEDLQKLYLDFIHLESSAFCT